MPIINLPVDETTQQAYRTAQKFISEELRDIEVPLEVLMQIQLAAVNSSLLATQVLEGMGVKQKDDQISLALEGI